METILERASNIKAKIINTEQISGHIKIGLKGKHQYENASTAYTAAKQFLPQCVHLKTKDALKKHHGMEE